LTFTCATHQNCTYIKQFSPLNTIFLRKTINFYEVLAQLERKAVTFHRIKPNGMKIDGFLFSSAALLGCFFHSLIISHVIVKVQVFSLPMLYLKHKEGQRTREKQNLLKQN